MTEKAGTTAHWERPWYATYALPVFPTKFKIKVAWVDLLDVLIKIEMVQSKAEARRLIKQGRVWDTDNCWYDFEIDRVKQNTIRITEYKLMVEPGCRLVIGNAKLVSTSKGDISDPTKNKIIEFVLAPENDPRCNSGIAARIVRWALGGFRS